MKRCYRGRCRIRLLAIVVVAGIHSSSGYAAPPEYLPGALSKPQYKASFDQLFNEDPAPVKWIDAYRRNEDPQIDLPAKNYFSEETGPVEVFAVCRTFMCESEEFIVAFTNEGTQAWGFFASTYEVRFYGDPPLPIRTLLRSIPTDAIRSAFRNGP